MQQPVSAAFTGPRNVCRILVCPLYFKLVGFHTGKVSVAGGVSQGEKRHLQKPWRHYSVQTGLRLYR